MHLEVHGIPRSSTEHAKVQTLNVSSQPGLVGRPRIACMHSR